MTHDPIEFVLDQISDKMDRILELTPQGVSLLDVAAYLSTAVSTLSVIEEKHHRPMPPAIRMTLTHCQRLIDDIVRAELRHDADVQ